MSNYKIQVDERTTKLVQEALFRMGWTWRSKDTEVRYLKNTGIYILESEIQQKTFDTGNIGDLDTEVYESIKLPEGL